ncbi:cyclin-dependent protein kinase inhibitor SMR1-like [Prosopis cineraria]|uniref:cyclin-dependent protein kinase inhibitor SMR1-like n=1 Tax=Prosopis cineraria TaxID=364024 RepID=UPI00240F5967|nr:cyclin-dependent protein kinase inhibitor SMR1-like [Prosopis cineraria]
MSASDSTGKQPDVVEASSGMAKEPELKDVNDMDDDGCKTPTRPENQIRVQSCPPAPRKRRPTPSSTSNRTFFTLQCIIVLPETIDAFFPASGQSSSGATKRRRTG